MRSTFVLISTFAMLALLQGCAAGPNPAVDMAAADGGTAGFFAGLWHGMIFPITFFISLFTDNVSIYDVHNIGGFYDFGFILGVCISSAACRSRPARRKNE